MQISKRLTAVSGLITPGCRLADVGTDHGYIPIKLVLSGRIPSAIAMDVNQGPLERAQAHIREYHLETQITARLSDGLEQLSPGEADSVLIAGMGGMLTVRILKNGKAVLKQVKELILQPQSDIREVRLFLQEEGFRIAEEDMVEEDGKFYPMMRAVPDGGKKEELSELQLLYGPCLLSGKHPVLLRYLEHERGLLERVQNKLSREETQGALQRREEIAQSLWMNEQAGCRITCSESADHPAEP